jgi:diguanylate cyclase (GGDEF)-like protein
VKVTASFGIAGFHGSNAPDLDELLRNADEALYRAKREGRNRLEFSVALLGDGGAAETGHTKS